MNRRALPPFTSEMTKRERIMALAYIPFHVLLLPLLMTWLSVYAGLMDEVTANVLCYSIGYIFRIVKFRCQCEDVSAFADAEVIPFFKLSVYLERCVRFFP